MSWGWLNTFGLIIVVFLLIPNIIYAFKKKHIESSYTNKVLSIFEQIGRYGSMILMALNIGIPELGFWSKTGILVWLFSIPTLILIYWIVWIIYFKMPKKVWAMLLAIIPGVIFILHGVLLGHWLLIIFGAIFSVSHIYITYRSVV